METIKHKQGIPTLADFASTSGAPLIINDLTGVMYTVVETNVVIQVSSIMEARTDDPANPVPGQLWLRTDL